MLIGGQTWKPIDTAIRIYQAYDGSHPSMINSPAVSQPKQLQAGFATERWTLKHIAALIEREFGVHYHPRYLERPLKAHGFSLHRPATRAKERDELAIAVWPKRDWVVLKRRPSGKAARSFFGTRRATASAPGQAPPGRGAGSPRCSSA